MDALDHRQVPAIVIGRGPTALGILRCLRMAGIPAYAACPPGDLVTRSRWYRPLPGPAPWDGSLGPRAWDKLRDLPLPRAVLIPSADDAALWLSDLPGSALAGRFAASTSTRATLETLQDKARFAAFLQGTDIAHPPTFRIEREQDIDAIPFDRLDRIFIKPVNSQQFSDVVGVKGVWVRSRDELLANWRRLHAGGFGLMAQEYVPGAASDHYFVDGFRDAHGRIAGVFARRRLRISPPDFGNSSYCRGIPADTLREPVEAMHALLARLAYRGIFSAEFKRDARDGSYRILEVNTRAWTYVEFAARCGLNTCAMAHRDALGLPVEADPRACRVGAGCVDLPRDLSAVRAEHAPRAWLRALPQWIGAHYHSFRFDDPHPGLSIARQMLSEKFARKPKG